MATNDQTESREIVYPENCTSEKSRKKHKDTLLRDKPDTLYFDNSDQKIGQTVKRVKTNLIFYTTMITEWKSATNDKYQHVDKTEIEYGEKFTIFRDKLHDRKKPLFTIHFYTNGTVLVQSNEKNLNLFENSFAELKARVHTERDQTQMNILNNPPPPPSDGEEGAEERDQPQTTNEDASSSIIDNLNNLSVK